MPIRPTPLAIPFILAASCAAAPAPQQAAQQLQSQTEIAQSGTVLVAPPNSQGCPVDLFSQRQANAVITFARDGSRHGGESLYRLDFKVRDTPQIAAATVVAYGAPAGGGARLTSSSAADASETFHLDPPVGNRSFLHSELRLRTLSGISWIEITRIDYTDGTAWHASRDTRCITEPNGLLLVR